MNQNDNYFICPNCMSKMTELDEFCPNCGKPNSCFNRVAYQTALDKKRREKEEERRKTVDYLLQKDKAYIEKEEESVRLLRKQKKVFPCYIVMGILLFFSFLMFINARNNPEQYMLTITIGIITAIAGFAFLGIAIALIVHNKRLDKKYFALRKEMYEMRQKMEENL